MRLNREMLEAALYCCSPTGLGQLVQHLHMRNVEWEGDALNRELGALLASGKAITKAVALPGAGSVDLISLRGYGLGGA